jgi:chromosome segregation protein
MKLKKLELIGFKSFADKTVFDFEGSITSLVGPNGSGKSNVVDALKWVLGERSARKLRGNEMSDMIFNGSNARSALGTAEVRVTLDNSEGTLPVDYEEVSISRQCYRSGESDYSMNGKRCRLKDIRGLLMDTGVGVSAYSFIEQGQVDRLLQASSSERREVLEEAAGINQYLEQKKEAERKLDRVHSNLQRVTDIIDELSRQLRSVRRQASKARRYKRYTDELKRLRLALGVHRRRELRKEQTHLQESIEEKQQKRQSLVQQLEESKAALGKAQQELEAVREQLSEAEDRLSHIDARQYSLGREIKMNGRRIEELEKRREELTSRREKVASSLGKVREEIEQTERKLQQANDDLEGRRSRCRERSAELSELQNECSELESRVEEGKSEVFGLMQKESKLQNEISMLRSERETLQKRLERQKQRDRQIQQQCRELAQQREEKEATLEELGRKLEEVAGTLQETDDELSEESRRVEELGSEMSELKAELRGKRSRQQVLQDLQDRAEGVGSGVQELMEKVDTADSPLAGSPGLLANLFDVASEDALAVEAALGHLVQAVAVERPDQAAEALRMLRDGEKGRADVVPLADLRAVEPADLPEDAEGVERLLDRVTYPDGADSALRWLVADCLVVDDAERAMDLVEAGLPEGVRVVTRAGDCIAPGGVWAAGEPESGSIISRRSELAELAEEIEGMQERLRQLESEREERIGRVRELRQQKNRLSAREDELSRRENQARSAVSLLASKEEQREEELELVRSEAATLEKDIKRTESRRKETGQKLVAAGEQRKEKQEDLDALKDQAENQREEREDLSRELSELKNELGRIEEQQKSRRNLLNRLRRQLEQQNGELERIGDEQRASAQQMEEAQETIRKSRKERDQLEEEKSQLQDRAENRSENCKDVQKRIHGIQERMDELSAKREKADERLQQLRMKENESRVNLENLYDRIAEECGINLKVLELRPEHWREKPLFVDAVIEEYQQEEPEAEGTVAQWYRDAEEPRGDEEAEQEEDEPEVIPLEEAAALRDEVLEIVGDEETDWDGLDERADELRRKVEKMGGANLDAIREQDELEQRAEFLANQKEDLEEAQAHEREIIRELSRKSRENFLETFNAVRENFQELVRKLFGGGSGDIMLDDEADDVLEAGIEITVRPPGKENRSISLLSGGEKALSAVALLFSIFEAKPSPFCLLDEVDAPLDEANVGRFLSLLKDYSEDTQFVIVTHNKTTMSAAETLYGISLQEDGVSNKVAVNFEEVDNKLEEMTRETRMAEMRAKAG